MTVTELRVAGRMLRKAPVFSATAAGLLAIGIAANTLIFGAVNALLLRPLPVKHPENLVRIIEVHPNDFVTWDLPPGLCDAAAERASSLAEVLCQGEADVAMTDGSKTERVRVHMASRNFFSSLGVRAELGRVLSAEDDRTAAKVAVLSYGFWQRQFGRERSVLGRTIVLGGTPFTVVGVTPEDFNGLAVDTSPDVRVPIADSAGLSGARLPYAQIFGRLRGGVTLERANREIDAQLHEAYEQELGPAAASIMRSHLRVESVARGVSALRVQLTRGLEAAMAGVALLLLMACANVAGLLLARASVRAQEIGVRLALGAGPVRIVRQLLTEGLLLGAAGGLAGLALTKLGIPLLERGLPAVRDRGAVLQPLALHIEIDWRVLGFSAAITLLTAVLFTLSPALRCIRTDVAGVLRGSRGAARTAWMRHGIVGAQVALCTVILMGAALLVETLHNMRTLDSGFDREHVATFTIDPSLHHYSAEQARILSKTLLERAAALPGVRGAAIASRAVMRGTGVKATFAAAGTQVSPSDFLNCSLNSVTPGYFATMGMKVLAGRDFTWSEPAGATPQPVLVNQAFARRFFPGRDPVGRRIGFPGPGGVATGADQIVGVVSDAKYRSLREPLPATVYTSAAQGFDSEFILHVRTAQRPETIESAVAKLLRSIDPALPVVESHTLREEVEASLWQERLLAWLAGIFGAVAVLLAGIGLYGALDYAVEARRREIGVRVALGAKPRQIAGLLMGTAAAMTGAGLAVGMAAYAAGAEWLRRILFETGTWDARALGVVVAVVAGLAILGALPAALRAAGISAAEALRAE